MGSRMDELEKVLGNLLEQSNDVITEKVEPVKNGSLESEKEWSRVHTIVVATAKLDEICRLAESNRNMQNNVCVLIIYLYL